MRFGIDIARMASRVPARGASLLESLLAATVIAVALLSMAVQFVTTQSVRRTTHELTLATSVARFAIEEITAIRDFDYVLANLNGYCFRVPELEGVDFDKRFSDGTSPTFSPSIELPPLDPASVVEPTPDVGDPLLDKRLDRVGMALPPVASHADTTRAFGLVLVEQLYPDMLQVTVRVQFRSRGANRYLEMHAHKLRSFNADDFQF